MNESIATKLAEIAKDDSVTNWYEITEEEYKEILKEQEEEKE